jgi:hypothetical protein
MYRSNEGFCLIFVGDTVLLENMASITLTAGDCWLLILCPIFAVFGAAVYGGSLENNSEKYPKGNERTLRSYFTIEHISWWSGLIATAIATGLFVALLFIGSIKNEAGSIARVVALSMLTGYSGHRMWKKQASVGMMALDKAASHAVVPPGPNT